MSLVRVVLSDERPIAALPQGAEALQHLLAFLRLPGAGEGEAEVVGGRGVVGLGRDGRAEGRDRLRVPAFLQIELPEVDLGPHVGGVQGRDSLEARLRIFDPVEPPRHQPQDVRRLG